MPHPATKGGRYRPQHVLERVGRTLKGAPLFSDSRPLTRRRLLSRKRLLLSAVGLAAVGAIGAVLGPGAAHNGPTQVVTNNGASPGSVRDAVRSALPGQAGAGGRANSAGAVAGSPKNGTSVK
ncbi:MAG: hypothetical protein ACRDJU_04540, partial [Actinomycetota bacterium]